MKIAVTGATGFVGQALCPYLADRLGATIIQLNRHTLAGELSLSHSDAALTEALADIDCLVHLAARAHTRHATADDFKRDNQQLCTRLAQIAINAEIPRVIYLSSIKVNGESTRDCRPFTPDDKPAPEDDYGKSKFECELILKELLKDTQTQLVVIRPPLVYGRLNKGNLAALQRLIELGIPLPFANIHNKRDLVSLHNLCSLISDCCTKSEAAGHTFMVSDGVARSTAEIIELLATSMQRQARVFGVPNFFFNALGWAKPDITKRLTENLEVDISATKQILNWNPEPL
jgi:nucleoside-diphosphate-sugar epimerase